VQERSQTLYPILIRAADVVGATCIGIATDARFRDLRFDTAIADEAGQIPACDLLVPLVRAQRAVLVGDHKQLPPFVDEEIRALLDDDDVESIALLEQSLFEKLFQRAPETHKAMLDTQYRMPASIANLASLAFYENRYRTAPDRQVDPVMPFFQRRICFVDTGHHPDYRERLGQREWETGYRNPGEAQILAQLAAAYLKAGHQIGVIVPYRLQIDTVRAALRRRHSELDENALRDLVATVDAFQGKERAVILFGFTRSNDWGGVGFLRELRRLNVTITRARQQLVLVGDSETLRNAGDPGFRNFARSLLAYVQQSGQYLDLEQLEEILRGKES
jgi:superfamily I DNA and/or RNA helicase